MEWRSGVDGGVPGNIETIAACLLVCYHQYGNA